MDDLAQHFSKLGGELITPVQKMAARMQEIRGAVFDWDGVFNPGVKGDTLPSGFNEADSMGTNMLRFGFWKLHGRLPVFAVISGAENKTAQYFAERERFNNVYLGVRDKQLALDHFCKEHQLHPEQLACVFDDINDLAMADRCAIRALINRPASPLFKQYIRRRGLCDYISAGGPTQYGLREITELMLGLLGVFDSVVESRVAYDQSYQDYFGTRQKTVTRYYRQADSSVVRMGVMPAHGI